MNEKPYSVHRNSEAGNEYCYIVPEQRTTGFASIHDAERYCADLNDAFALGAASAGGEVERLREALEKIDAIVKDMTISEDAVVPMIGYVASSALSPLPSAAKEQP